MATTDYSILTFQLAICALLFGYAAYIANEHKDDVETGRRNAGIFVAGVAGLVAFWLSMESWNPNMWKRFRGRA